MSLNSFDLPLEVEVFGSQQIEYVFLRLRSRNVEYPLRLELLQLLFSQLLTCLHHEVNRFLILVSKRDLEIAELLLSQANALHEQVVKPAVLLKLRLPIRVIIILLGDALLHFVQDAPATHEPNHFGAPCERVRVPVHEIEFFSE